MVLPLQGWVTLRHYSLRWLPQDCLAGLTVAAYLVPQCMAYGELAGVGPAVGLWTILPALFVYFWLGSSPQVSVGPESTTAIMTAATVGTLVRTYGGSYPTVAALLACLVGVVCLIAYLARLGFLADLLSRPILIGYMTGVALIMVVGQLGKVSGIAIESDSILGQMLEFLGHFSQIHPPTLVLSLCLLAFLFGMQAFFPSLPGPLLAVLLATLVVWLGNLEGQGIAVVGAIPVGFPQPQLPLVSRAETLQVLAAAIGIAIVAYSDNVLTARAFATRNRYTIDPGQELLALGMANLATGLMQGFPVSSSASRATIGDSLGSKTQVYSLVAWGVVGLVLLWLRPLLALFPKAALGALVIYAATRLIDLGEFRRLKQFRWNDFALAILTTLGVLATSLLVGVAIAVALSVIELLARVARPHDAVMGKVPGLAGLHDISDWPGATTIPGLVLYRYDAPLFFANVEDFKRRALGAIDEETDPVHWFVLNAEAIVEIDITAADMLADLYDELTARGITMGMARVKQDLYMQLERSGLLNQLGDHIYFTLPTAIEAFLKSRDGNGNPLDSSQASWRNSVQESG
ncbi:MAG: SulP family inorganic anion transporter [Nodosilinea sp.]